MRNRDYDAIAAAADETFSWMVSSNGGFWLLIQDHFTRRYFSWWRYFSWRGDYLTSRHAFLYPPRSA